MLVGEHGLQRVGQKNGRRKSLTFVCFCVLGLSCVGSSGHKFYPGARLEIILTDGMKLVGAISCCVRIADPLPEANANVGLEILTPASLRPELVLA